MNAPGARAPRESAPHTPGAPAGSPADLIVVPEVARRLGAAFTAAGHELHLVGGTVRDALLGRPDTDLDFTTDARPEQVLAIVAPLGVTWTTGMEFGTIGVQVEHRLCEITTFRADRYDRVSRKPEVVYGDSLAADLLRRDFTMNAMALSVTPGASGAFTDPYGGLADLARGVLRTPATPEESFADDPLRMLRAARFASTLGVAVSEDALSAMSAMAGELGRVSAERVRGELNKLLLGRAPRAGLELLVDTGLAEVVLPELPALRMAADEHGQHKDVYAHTLQVLEQAVDLEDADGPDPVLRWAALLHDIGKPATRATGPDGRVSFHHHEVVGAKLARKRLRELRFGKQFVDDVAQLVFLHLRFYGYRDGEWTDSAVRRYVVDAGPLLPRLHKLVRSDCTTRNRRKAAALSAAYDTLEQRVDDLQRQEELDAVRPDLDGNEIMTLLGIPAGRAVGEAYRHLLALRMEQGPLGRDAAEQELRRWWSQRQAQGGQGVQP